MSDFAKGNVWFGGGLCFLAICAFIGSIADTSFVFDAYQAYDDWILAYAPALYDPSRGGEDTLATTIFLSVVIGIATVFATFPRLRSVLFILFLTGMGFGAAQATALLGNSLIGAYLALAAVAPVLLTGLYEEDMVRRPAWFVFLVTGTCMIAFHIYVSSHYEMSIWVHIVVAVHEFFMVSALTYISHLFQRGVSLDDNEESGHLLWAMLGIVCVMTVWISLPLLIIWSVIYHRYEQGDFSGHI